MTQTLCSWPNSQAIIVGAIYKFCNLFDIMDFVLLFLGQSGSFSLHCSGLYKIGYLLKHGISTGLLTYVLKIHGIANIYSFHLFLFLFISYYDASRRHTSYFKSWASCLSVTWSSPLSQFKFAQKLQNTFKRTQRRLQCHYAVYWQERYFGHKSK